jgi:hypothetical protein
MTEKYTGVEKYIFSDVYTLFLRFKDMADTDIAWQAYLREADALCVKYKGNRLLREMISSITCQIEHRLRNTTVNGLTYDQWEKVIKGGIKQ